MGNAENGKLSWVLAPEERFAAFEPASARPAGSQSTTGSSAGARVVWWQPRSRPTSAPPPRSTAGARGPAPRPAAGCGTPPAVRTHSPGGQFHPGRAHPRAKSVMPLQCPFDGRLPDLRRAQGDDAGATIRRADTARPPSYFSARTGLPCVRNPRPGARKSARSASWPRANAQPRSRYAVSPWIVSRTCLCTASSRRLFSTRPASRLNLFGQQGPHLGRPGSGRHVQGLGELTGARRGASPAQRDHAHRPAICLGVLVPEERGVAAIKAGSTPIPFLADGRPLLEAVTSQRS